jgi:3-dehydroquinate synthase
METPTMAQEPTTQEPTTQEPTTQESTSTEASTEGTALHVPLRREVDESYHIVIGSGLSEAVAEFVTAHLPDLQVALVTDTTVRGLFAADVERALAARDRACTVFTMPPGERHKTRQTKAAVEDAMIDAGFGRDSCVLAVGGGVVTDLAGFVAGTFARGVPVVNCPTTLLAAADASLGGKTGVDTDAATNLIGVFHQPRRVFIDLDTWRTLPVAELRTGLAETVKHACIADPVLFARLEKAFVDSRLDATEALADPALAEYTAVRNCEIKRQFVVSDVHESNQRMVLNLGHTFGRALEAACDYRWSHGEAVSVGLCLQAQLGRELGFVSDEDVDRLVTLLSAIGLPTRVPDDVSDDLLLEKVALDKKVRGRTRDHGRGPLTRW